MSDISMFPSSVCTTHACPMSVGLRWSSCSLVFRQRQQQTDVGRTSSHRPEVYLSWHWSRYTGNPARLRPLRQKLLILLGILKCFATLVSWNGNWITSILMLSPWHFSLSLLPLASLGFLGQTSTYLRCVLGNVFSLLKSHPSVKSATESC